MRTLLFKESRRMAPSKKFLVHRGTDVQQIYVWSRPCRPTPNVIQYMPQTLKWWKYFFWFCVDIAITNSFICMKESKKSQNCHQKWKRIGEDTTPVQGWNKPNFLLVGSRQQGKGKIQSNLNNCGNAHWQVKMLKGASANSAPKHKR